jgi:N-acetylmuramoyl-L-alanine amidase
MNSNSHSQKAHPVAFPVTSSAPMQFTLVRGTVPFRCKFRLFHLALACLTPIALQLMTTQAMATGTITQSPPANQTTPTVSNHANKQLIAQGISRPVLKNGDRGDTVSELQAMLRLLGYYNGSVDGVFSSNTATAVASFQQAAGLFADGIVGAETWNRLLPSSTVGFNPSPSPRPSPSPFPSPAPAPAPAPTGDFPVLRRGDRGAAVTRLQERLQALEFYSDAADGVFGPGTEAAVIDAQNYYGLEADGIVGGATWDVLF